MSKNVRPTILPLHPFTPFTHLDLPDARRILSSRMPHLLSRPFHLPHRLRPWLLLAGGLVLYLSMLGQRDIVTSHEGRVVQTARQMAQAWPWEGRTVEVSAVELTRPDRTKELVTMPGGRVNPWLVPVLSGKVRLQKPPLPNWCAAVTFRVFGFGEGRARLVPALMAAFATLLVYDLARVLMGRVAAWVAGLVSLGSYFVFDEYRKAMVDPYLAFFTLAAVWAYVKGSGFRVQGSGGNAAADSSLNPEPRTLNPLCLAFYLSLALGFLSKGPVIFLHIGIALIAYHLCYRRRAPWRVRHHLLGAALMIAVAAPWYLYVLRTVPHAWDIFRYESLGEVTADTKEDARPWFFYALSVVQLSLPWAPLFVLGVLLAFNRGRGRKKDRRHWFPLVWYAGVLVFFSFVTQKKNAYLLPALPAQTLLVTQGVLLTLAAARRNRFRGPQAALAWAQVGMGVALAVLLSVLVAGAPDALAAGAGGEADEGAASLSTSGKWDAVGEGVAVGAVALAAAALPAWWVLRRRPRGWVAGQAVAYAVLVAMFFNLHVGPRENRRSPKPVAREVLALLGEGGGPRGSSGCPSRWRCTSR